MEAPILKRVFFIRHGETEANLSRVTQGPNNPLSEVGVRQAGILAKRVQKLDFDVIISSDYERARLTAEHIHQATSKPLELSALFREYRRPSEFLGKSIGELGGDNIVAQGFTQIDANFDNKDWHYSDEENFFDLKERAESALRYLESHQDSRILVVSHGNFLRALLGVMWRKEKYSPEDYRDTESTFELFNTSVSVAEYKPHWRYPDGTWIISAWNDQAHLADLS